MIRCSLSTKTKLNKSIRAPLNRGRQLAVVQDSGARISVITSLFWLVHACEVDTTKFTELEKNIPTTSTLTY